ncbi:hypothetical protein PaeBR_09580 [Paenibacillus sp. BR2-3]|uniref:hypothetical protein n=1 Tax=Paenibacillus sp. BR2-3 TaxID=3048494 RepID=UPI003977B8C9
MRNIRVLCGSAMPYELPILYAAMTYCQNRTGSLSLSSTETTLEVQRLGVSTAPAKWTFQSLQAHIEA